MSVKVERMAFRMHFGFDVFFILLSFLEICIGFIFQFHYLSFFISYWPICDQVWTGLKDVFLSPDRLTCA